MKTIPPTFEIHPQVPENIIRWGCARAHDHQEFYGFHEGSGCGYGVCSGGGYTVGIFEDMGDAPGYRSAFIKGNGAGNGFYFGYEEHEDSLFL